MRLVKRSLSSFLLLLALVALCGCTPVRWELPPEKGEPAPGDVFLLEPLSVYPHFVLRLAFWWQDLSEIDTSRGISLYRIGYYTDHHGALARASGLLAVPDDVEASRGFLSWQRGTATRKENAPSVPDPYNGIVAAAVFSGDGYITFAPDLPGFGLSDRLHGYYDTPPIAASILDGIAASRQVLNRNGVTWPERVFLTGFSQGGHASLAALRRAQQTGSNLEITAVASVAGAVDLRHMGFSNAMEARSKLSCLYIAWIALTYSRDYPGNDLASLIRSPWKDELPGLFDLTRGGDEILSALPDDPRDMLTDEFLHTWETGGDHWFLAALEENGLLDWVPQVPVRMYYGDRDVIVTPQQALTFERLGQAGGGDVVAVSVGPYGHDASILVAAPLVRDWFESL